ncbi:MAG: hypothetical protein ABJB03_00925 [Rhodoglobus sp.]
MAAAPTPVAVIDGRVGRKLGNALTMTFSSGAANPVATALQGGAAGFGGKLAILLGFRNGGQGRHTLTYPDGSKLIIPVRDWDPTPITRGDGSPVATITRAETSVATLPDGTELFHFGPAPVDAKTSDKYSILVTTPAGEPVAMLEMMRSAAGWISGEDILEFVMEGPINTQTGGALAIPIPGTRMVLYREVEGVERDVLLAACVELGIGIRAYFTEMGKVVAWL